MKLNLPLAEVVDSQRRINNVEVLPILVAHVLPLEKRWYKLNPLVWHRFQTAPIGL